MTGTLYDHLTAVIIIGALFVAAVIAVPAMSYVNLLYVDQQQLRNVALETLKTMLLDTGYPLNWGLDSNVERFGLALSESSSSYVLDPDKVQRLVENNSLGWLEPEKVRQMLGLQGYGFSIRILPPFNVTVDYVNFSPSGLFYEFNLTVKFNDEKPIPNAIVKASIFYSYRVKGIQGENDTKYSIQYTEADPATTDEIGKCRITGKIAHDPGKIQQDSTMIIFQTTVAEVTTVTTMYKLGSPPDDIATVNVVGDEMILTRPEKGDPNDVHWICDVWMITEDGCIPLYYGTQDDKINWGSKDRWNKTLLGLKSMEPAFFIFDFNAVRKHGGREGALMIGPYPNYMGNRVTQYSAPQSPSGGTVKLQRAVNISGMTYIFELMLWKEM